MSKMVQMRTDMVMPVPVRREPAYRGMYFYYDDETKAKQASIVAEEMGARMWRAGVDFTYLLPGQISKRNDGTFMVVVP